MRVSTIGSIDKQTHRRGGERKSARTGVFDKEGVTKRARRQTLVKAVVMLVVTIVGVILRASASAPPMVFEHRERNAFIDRCSTLSRHLIALGLDRAQ
jgi:hypothetical protein